MFTIRVTENEWLLCKNPHYLDNLNVCGGDEFKVYAVDPSNGTFLIYHNNKWIWLHNSVCVPVEERIYAVSCV